ATELKTIFQPASPEAGFSVAVMKRDRHWVDRPGDVPEDAGDSGFAVRRRSFGCFLVGRLSSRWPEPPIVSSQISIGRVGGQLQMMWSYGPILPALRAVVNVHRRSLC